MKNLRYKFEIFKSGFTLAEVLITLVIIGVVAALTISPLVNTYVESSTVAKVKKGLSILGQAKKLAETQNGSIEGWNFSDGTSPEAASQLWNYLKPHISVAKDCGAGQDCYKNVEIKVLSGGAWANYNSSPNYYKFVLADGGVMWFRTAQSNKCSDYDGGINNVCAVFWYDVNGDKGPNQVARDIFVYMMSVEGVYPHLFNDCYKNDQGWGCTSYIIKHNNMNYLH